MSLEITPTGAQPMKNRQNVEIKARGKSKFLSHDDERILVMRWQKNGDDAARIKLIAAHKPMLSSVAYRASRSTTDFDDLLQEATIGFTIALDRYDPSYGIRLGTWAKYYAMKETRDFRLANCAPVRLPNSRRTKSIEASVIPIIRGLEEVFGVNLTRAEKEMICLDEGFDLSELDTYSTTTSPAQFIGSSDDDETGITIVADVLETETMANAPRVSELVFEAIENLDDRSRYVIRRRFFCDNTDSRPSLEVVSDELGISRGRTGQVERAALAALQIALSERGLELEDLL